MMDALDREIITALLREAREQDTGRVLGEKMGVSAQFISNVLHGRAEASKKMWHYFGLPAPITHEPDEDNDEDEPTPAPSRIKLPVANGNEAPPIAPKRKRRKQRITVTTCPLCGGRKLLSKRFVNARYCHKCEIAEARRLYRLRTDPTYNGPIE
jgi:hypothetical protein